MDGWTNSPTDIKIIETDQSLYLSIVHKVISLSVMQFVLKELQYVMWLVVARYLCRSRGLTAGMGTICSPLNFELSLTK